MNTKNNNKSITQLWGFLFIGLIGGYGLATQPVHAAPFAYVTRLHSNSVSVIDTATTPIKVVNSVSVGDTPLGVAVAPDGKRVYVATQGNYVSVIDTATHTVVKTVPIDAISHFMAITPDGKKVYVTTYAGFVSVIDTATNVVVDTIDVDGWDVAAAPDGKRVYVTNYTEGGNFVSMIDTATNNVVDSVAVGLNPGGVAVAPDGKRVYVANYGDGNGGGSVSVIDTTTTHNSVIDTVPIGQTPAIDVTVALDGKRVYVTDGFESLMVIDTTTKPHSIINTVTVGDSPYGVAVTPDGKRVYVANYSSSSVSVIDTATNNLVDTVSVGGSPDDIAIGPLPPSTQFSAFKVNTLTLSQQRRILFLLSTITLGKSNNGINPLNETVTLKLGNATITVPANSFKRNRNGQFSFVGQIDNGWIEMLITPSANNSYSFQTAAYGVDVSGVSNPVSVEVTLGNDSGKTSVNAIIQK
jgi:YVTN family beta-propeller protein